MVSKSKILEVLGGGSSELLLMEKVRRSLQANERVKYLLTLLQLAKVQAEEPAPNPDDLSVERKRAGIEDPDLDQAIPHTILKGIGLLEIPGGDRILAMALGETFRMCDPLILARRHEGQALKERLKNLVSICRPYLDGNHPRWEPLAEEAGLEKERPPEGEGAASRESPAEGPQGAGGSGPLVLPLELVGRFTSADRAREDSLHLVVMDAHKALNSLIAELSGQQEKIGGADALGLTPEDRRLVEAFTEGVNSTFHLKGGHQGLSTTAVRLGTKLMIQNDIGETDAHVVLLEIEDGKLELTYTDVHDKRVQFFIDMLSDLPIRWKKTESRYSSELAESNFILLRGLLNFSEAAEAATALRAIGSMLVFLIDWNKARKRVRTFLRGSDAADALLWAARERIGFMAFLNYGDEELIYEVLEALPRGTVRRGEPLSSILGKEGSIEFIKEALRISRETCDRQESRILLVDRLRCQLLMRAQKRTGRADDLLLEMASLGVEAGLTLRDALRALSRPNLGLITRSCERIQKWEERADDRLNRIRKLGIKDPQPLLAVAMYVDDAMDAMEDAADLARAFEEHYAGKAITPELLAMIEEGAELALRATQLFYKIIHHYRELVGGGDRRGPVRCHQRTQADRASRRPAQEDVPVEVLLDAGRSAAGHRAAGAGRSAGGGHQRPEPGRLPHPRSRLHRHGAKLWLS
ncbi:MAG: hypothetical protein HY717_13930 [Planctomycetes bacterium]|nr:hypothetical protein [Planctomycetota bacterium]